MRVSRMSAERGGDSEDFLCCQVESGLNRLLTDIYYLVTTELLKNSVLSNTFLPSPANWEMIDWL